MILLKQEQKRIQKVGRLGVRSRLLFISRLRITTLQDQSSVIFNQTFAFNKLNIVFEY